jgi:hypothetical protein
MTKKFENKEELDESRQDAICGRHHMFYGTKGIHFVNDNTEYANAVRQHDEVLMGAASSEVILAMANNPYLAEQLAILVRTANVTAVREDIEILDKLWELAIESQEFSNGLEALAKGEATIVPNGSSEFKRHTGLNSYDYSYALSLSPYAIKKD